MNVCFLGSGSRGNSFYVSGEGTKILIDVGFYLNVIEQRLSDAEIHPDEINGILITHEHNDHICGLNIFVRKWGIPVFMNELTFDSAKNYLKDIKVSTFNNGSDFSIGGLQIKPFSLLHDCADNSGFVIANKGKKVFYATDLGFVTALVKERMKGCDLVVFESNHDRDMLINGKYPWHLKQRILSRQGHISNEESAFALKEGISDNVKRIILAHISQENNHPDILMNTHKKILDGVNVILSIASQDRVNDIYEV